MHWPNRSEWEALTSEDSHARWKELIEPIMQVSSPFLWGVHFRAIGAAPQRLFRLVCLVQARGCSGAAQLSAWLACLVQGACCPG